MNGEARAGRIPHVSALDGARGAAVAGVLFFHGGHLLGGYLGVDFFFVLSGFLITSLLLAESNRTGSVGLGGFWARRARRLLPALAVLMVGVAVYCLALASADQFTQIRGDAFATLGYVANWREIFAGQNYFALFTAPSPLNHTWSLAIEEQFYLVWPLLFVGLLAWWKRAVPKAVLVTSLVLACGSTALMFTLYHASDVSRAYFGTDTRATAILLGAALASWLAIHGPTQHRGRRIALEVLGIAGAIALGICWARLGGESSTLYRGGFLLCGVSATAVIAAAVHPEPGPIARILSWRPLCALGLVSYGVYLYHWPIDVAFDSKQMGFRGWPLFGFDTALALAVAYVSYRFVEQPIRHGALSSVQWRKLTPAVAVGLVGLIFFSTTGATANQTVLLGHPGAAATRAFKDAPPGSTRVMVVGDSVGFFLGKDFKALKEQPPLAVFNAGIQGCNFFPNVTRVRYHSSNGTSFSRHTLGCDPGWEVGALKRFRPAIVFWIVSNPAGAVFARGKWYEPCTPAYASAYANQLKEELSVLGAGGAKVAMITEVYPRYVFANSDPETDCDNRIRRSVAAHSQAQLIDLQAFICPGGQCRDRQNGVKLRVDGEHFEGPGGRLVAQWMLDQVTAAKHP